MNDIDASSSKTAAYDPGNLWGGGVFDGQGFTIRGLYIVSMSGSGNIGLFGGVFTDSSRVINLRVEVDSIYGGGNGAVGGIAGINRGTVSNCSVSGRISGRGAVGGLVGQNEGGKITNCYSIGNVNGSGYATGGLVGKNGGLNSGTNVSTITNCYSTGNVSGDGNKGGLVGDNDGTITNCYATGKVIDQQGSSLGGLVRSGASPSDVRNSYWDTETSGQTASSGGGTGKTTAQMKTKSTFVNWDFNNVWMIDEGVSYPSLFGFGKYSLRYRAAAGGYIALGDTAQIVESGSHGGTVVAMPNDGYEFTMWSDGASDFVRTDSNVTSNKTVTANFCVTANIKPLTYKAGSGGTISGPASQKVCGTSNGLPVTAVPNDGYRFVEWSDGSTDTVRIDRNVQVDIAVTAYFKDAAGNVLSVVSSDRVIPLVNSPASVSVAPISALTAEFAVGPNPVGALRATPVQFFRTGTVIKSATLYIYDASGNVVKKISVSDKASVGGSVKRSIGSWDLTDKRGRRVSEGTYLIKGAVKAKGGKTERVSAVVGVR